MSKQYYFLAGLPRSGNTVLSSILNQNPDIYSSPLSPLSEYMGLVSFSSNNNQAAKINTYPERSDKVISKMIENYYEDVDKPFILDRSKEWGTPVNLNILKSYLGFTPKIIFTTRPVIEVLASYIAINKDRFIKSMHHTGFKKDESLDINDNICDFLMSPGRPLSRALESLKSIDDPKNAGVFHIVKYENLLANPEETMSKVYKFLEIDVFTHNFNDIQRIESYNESNADLPEDLHKVRPVLGKGNIKVEDYLSPRSIEKYKDFRYF